MAKRQTKSPFGVLSPQLFEEAIVRQANEALQTFNNRQTMAEHGSKKIKSNFVVVRDTSLKGKGLPGVHKQTLFDSPRAKKQWHMTQEGFQMRVSEQSINEELSNKLPTLTSPPEPL